MKKKYTSIIASLLFNVNAFTYATEPSVPVKNTMPAAAAPAPTLPPTLTEEDIIAEKKEAFLKNGFSLNEYELIAPVMKDIRKRRRILFKELTQLLMKFEFLTRGKIMTPGKKIDPVAADKELKKLQTRFIMLSQKISQIEIDSMNALKDKLEVRKWFLAFKILGQGSNKRAPQNNGVLESKQNAAPGSGNSHGPQPHTAPQAIAPSTPTPLPPPSKP